jgi:hypothetical protein
MKSKTGSGNTARFAFLLLEHLARPRLVAYYFGNNSVNTARTPSPSGPPLAEVIQ